MRKRLLTVAMAMAILLQSASVFADATFFLGAMGTRNVSPNPKDQLFWGGALGKIIWGEEGGLGLEGEAMIAPYSNQANLGVKILSLSVFAQTKPFAGDIKFYGIGGGTMVWTERGYFKDMGSGFNFGGGIKIPITDGLGIRADGRVYTFRDSPFSPNIARAYAGLNWEF